MEFDNRELDVVFLDWTPEIKLELEQQLGKVKEVDIVESSAFTGKDVLQVFGTYSEKFIDGLSAAMMFVKNGLSGRKVKIKMGDNEIELSGFGGNDVKSMKKALIDLASAIDDK